MSTELPLHSENKTNATQEKKVGGEAEVRTEGAVSGISTTERLRYQQIVENSKFYSSEETASQLNISVAQLLELRENGYIGGFRDGASWRFKRVDIQRYIEYISTESQKDDTVSKLPHTQHPSLAEDTSLAPHYPQIGRSSEDATIKTWVLDDEDFVLGNSDEASEEEDENPSFTRAPSSSSPEPIREGAGEAANVSAPDIHERHDSEMNFNEETVDLSSIQIPESREESTLDNRSAAQTSAAHTVDHSSAISNDLPKGWEERLASWKMLAKNNGFVRAADRVAKIALHGGLMGFLPTLAGRLLPIASTNLLGAIGGPFIAPTLDLWIDSHANKNHRQAIEKAAVECLAELAKRVHMNDKSEGSTPDTQTIENWTKVFEHERAHRHRKHSFIDTRDEIALARLLSEHAQCAPEQVPYLGTDPKLYQQYCRARFFKVIEELHHQSECDELDPASADIVSKFHIKKGKDDEDKNQDAKRRRVHSFFDVADEYGTWVFTEKMKERDARCNKALVGSFIAVPSPVSALFALSVFGYKKFNAMNRPKPAMTRDEEGHLTISLEGLRHATGGLFNHQEFDRLNVAKKPKEGSEAAYWMELIGALPEHVAHDRNITSAADLAAVWQVDVLDSLVGKKAYKKKVDPKDIELAKAELKEAHAFCTEKKRECTTLETSKRELVFKLDSLHRKRLRLSQIGPDIESRQSELHKIRERLYSITSELTSSIGESEFYRGRVKRVQDIEDPNLRRQKINDLQRSQEADWSSYRRGLDLEKAQLIQQQTDLSTEIRRLQQEGNPAEINHLDEQIIQVSDEISYKKIEIDSQRVQVEEAKKNYDRANESLRELQNSTKSTVQSVEQLVGNSHIRIAFFHRCHEEWEKIKHHRDGAWWKKMNPVTAEGATNLAQNLASVAVRNAGLPLAVTGGLYFSGAAASLPVLGSFAAAAFAYSVYKKSNPLGALADAIKPKINSKKEKKEDKPEASHGAKDTHHE